VVESAKVNAPIQHYVITFVSDWRHMQSVPITTNVVSSNPAKARCTRYNILVVFHSLSPIRPHWPVKVVYMTKELRPSSAGYI
jgi:hypothetical protein